MHLAEWFGINVNKSQWRGALISFVARMAALQRAEALQHHLLLKSVLQSLTDDFKVLSVLEPVNAQTASNDDNVSLNKAQVAHLVSHIAAGEARMEAGLLSLRSTAGSVQRHHAAGALRLAASSSVHAARRSILKALFYLLVCCPMTSDDLSFNARHIAFTTPCTADCDAGSRKAFCSRRSGATTVQPSCR